MKTYIFLAEGFEEIEAIALIDVLRRAEVDLISVSITSSLSVCSARNVVIQADALFSDLDFANAELLILPGGMPGTNNLKLFEPLNELLNIHFDQKKRIAAICAAPIILGALGILKGRQATCYPGFELQLPGAQVKSQNMVVSDTVLTAKGPGVAVNFALEIVKMLKGEMLARDIAKSMCVECY